MQTVYIIYMHVTPVSLLIAVHYHRYYKEVLKGFVLTLVYIIHCFLPHSNFEAHENIKNDLFSSRLFFVCVQPGKLKKDLHQYLLFFNHLL